VEGRSRETAGRAKATPEMRDLIRRRRKVAFSMLLILAGLVFYAYAIHYSGRLVLLQQASAADLTRGFIFGPFYLPTGASGVYGYSVQVPAAGSLWQTRIELLDAHGLTIHPQTDYILAGESAFGPSDSFSRASHFRLRDSGYYFLRFTQMDGTYAEAGAATPPVITLWVRAGAIRGWALWLPLALMGLALVLVWILW
jgi:hypothetical protein